jgi:RNA polymerase sigma-70 factor (ECF subfamily)
VNSDEHSVDISAAVAEAHRREWAAVLAATARITRDLDLAEECAQDAFARALQTWPGSGVPTRPGAWLTTVATNRARDLLRHESAFRRALPLLVTDDVVLGPEDADDSPVVGDDRLRLIFTCCHPALSREAQVALTLRLVCGLSTAEVARAFLVQEATMAARITRAKKKIATARIPYRIPSLQDLRVRVASVCEVLHLVFTTGHTAPTGEHLERTELIDRAIWQARVLHRLVPENNDVCGLLALMLLVDARRGTRQSETDALVLLSEQDRGRWNAAQIAEGVELVRRSLQQQPLPPSRYAVEAAIAAVHAEASTWEETNWAQIVGLYEVLGRLWPSPVVELNRAIAIGYHRGPEAGVAALEPLLAEPALVAYGYLGAARADLFFKLGRWVQACEAYDEALALTENRVEQNFLRARLAEARTHLAQT